MKWIALIAFGGVGLLALFFGVRWGIKRARLITAAQVAQGKVVGQQESPPPGPDGAPAADPSQTRYTPLIEFQTAQGERVRFASGSGRLGSPEFSEGTTLALIYDPERPAEAIVGAPSDAWLGPLVISLAGLVFFAMGLAAFLLVGSTDRDFAAMDQQMARDQLVFRPDAARVPCTIARVERVEGKQPASYVLICKGLRPGEGFEEEFASETLPFAPDESFLGRQVEVILDPQDRRAFIVELGPVLKEILQRQKGGGAGR